MRRPSSKCRKEIHCVGEVWSSTLFELRTALGNDAHGQSVMDRVVLEAQLHAARRRRTSATAREALLAADQLLYAGAHAGEIEAALVERKFCKRSGC